MKSLHILILSGISIASIILIVMFFVFPVTSPRIEDVQTKPESPVQNTTVSSNSTNYIPSLRCSISCSLQVSNPSNGTLLIVVPTDDAQNNAIWVVNHDASSFHNCVLNQFVGNNKTILKTYQEIMPNWDDKISPIDFVDGEKFTLECNTSHQSPTLVIPKCLSPSELQTLYSFHILFPTYVPDGYKFQCGIGTYSDATYYAYWNDDWKKDPLYSKNLLNMRMELEGAKKEVIGIQVMNGSGCSNGTISADDTLDHSYGDLCSNGTHYHLYGMLGTKDQLLKMEQSMKYVDIVSSR